ncbi:hypothetical protein BDE40_1766 [Litoreibacter halocynthiae]|uniref:Uncharacterized protein n=1 Tax=Litoreibacter halocynthiae TaxID=1242689 RepID=A0A4R7LK65_9RHOB|nr:DUF6476 family protein [Litoreibacter halocynthiae]TDT75042.1 hypothetical protein BDE40_1766 [Litoreibacter halocynthiae]
MDNDPEFSAEEPANLKFLRRLVTTLTATMIVGLVVMITLVVIRLNASTPDLALPAYIKLPDGTRATAFTQAPNWYAVVTADDRILIFNRDSGELTQQISVNSRP